MSEIGDTDGTPDEEPECLDPSSADFGCAKTHGLGDPLPSSY
jgi:hypothetical protein